MKSVVVLPAYHAEKTLMKTLEDIPYDFVDEVILVDDASSDGTCSLASGIAARGMLDSGRKINMQVHCLPKNRGYGGNQKECYKLALKSGAEIVTMLHPDFQYDPKVIKYFKLLIEGGLYDVMLGSRIRSRKEAISNGMPYYKYFANRLMTMVENIASGQNLSEWHTGMRAYRREVLEKIDFEKFSDDFVFDTQMLFAIVGKKYKIGELPVPVRYLSESSSINFKRSVKYGLLTMLETVKYIFRK